MDNKNNRGKEKYIKLGKTNRKKLTLGIVLTLTAVLLPFIGFAIHYIKDPGGYPSPEFVPPEILYFLPCVVLLTAGVAVLFSASDFLRILKPFAIAFALIVSVMLSFPWAEVCHDAVRNVFLPAYKNTHLYGVWHEKNTRTNCDASYESYLEKNTVKAEYKIVDGKNELILIIDDNGGGCVRAKTKGLLYKNATTHSFLVIRESRPLKSGGSTSPREDVENGYMYSVPMKSPEGCQITLWVYKEELANPDIDADAGDFGVYRCALQISRSGEEDVYMYSNNKELYLAYAQ